MKHLITALAFALATSGSFAASHAGAAPVKSAQQEKMALCNKDAAGKKGQEHADFMKACLAVKKDMAASPACAKSADDKKLAGAARNSHVKRCMAETKPEAKKG